VQVPKLSIFDFSVQPQSVLQVSHERDEIHINSISTRLTGSHQVGDVDLDDAFEMSLHVCLTPEGKDMCVSHPCPSGYHLLAVLGVCFRPGTKYRNLCYVLSSFLQSVQFVGSLGPRPGLSQPVL
jgi:hypothetical protein